MTQDLLPVEANTVALRKPREIVEEAKERANVLMEIVKEQHLSKRIGDKDHIQVEAWMTVAGFYGCSAGSDDAVPVEVDGIKGAKAHAVVRDREGIVVSEAVSYCMRDEPNWQNKPWFQLASMAQTRAMSKALANKFRSVAVLAGFSGTPSEEMTRPEEEHQSLAEAVYPWGQDKGKPISKVPQESLKWAVSKLEKDLADPAKASYKEKNTTLLQAILDELARRQA